MLKLLRDLLSKCIFDVCVKRGENEVKFFCSNSELRLEKVGEAVNTKCFIIFGLLKLSSYRDFASGVYDCYFILNKVKIW